MPSENFVTTETYDRDGSKKSKNLHPGYVKSAATGRKKLSEIKSFDSSSDDDDDDIEDPRKALRQLKNLSTRGQAELR